MRPAIPLMALGLILFVCATSFAEEISLTVRFDPPDVRPAASGAVSVSLPGTWRHLVTGEPVLPVRTARVLIPYGHRVTAVQVAVPAWLPVASGVVVEHAPRVRTVSGRGEVVPPPEAEPSPAIYGSNEPFPRAAHRALDVQFKRGAQILPVNLHPVRYEPASGRLAYAPEMRLVVRTEPSASARAVALPFRGTPADVAEIRRMVDNPSALAGYAHLAAEDLDAVDYLMIAPQTLEASVQAYATYKEATFGLSVQVTTLEWILAHGSGADAQEKIRNFIRDLYVSSSLQYVLLVGDADGPANEVIPMRHLFVSGTDPDGWVYFEDDHMASDLYYGCLDGNYNADGDARFGEPTDGPGGTDVDLLFDVHVGRFAVESEAELANLVNKTTAFETTEAPYQVLFVGETLDGMTEGGDHKEVVYSYMPAVPITRLYEDEGNFGRFRLNQAINSNQHQWLNHVGHANVTYNMTYYSGDVGDLHNTTYYLGYTHGCYCGSIDGRDDWGWYETDDCVIEYFTAKHSAGAFAYLANTRYGFYLQGRTDGPSNVYDWEFADAVFNEGIASIGAANDDSKEDCIGMLDPMNMMRWVYYELFLFGDPQTPLQFECDVDGDGHMAVRCGGDDCDDRNPAVHPGTTEECDGLDNDCDGLPAVEENDADQDGFRVCAGDCNDYDPAVNPDAVENCTDGIDNDCNDRVDQEDPVCAPADDDTDDDATDDDVTDDDAADDDAMDDDAADDDVADDDNDDDDDGCGCG